LFSPLAVSAFDARLAIDRVFLRVPVLIFTCPKLGPFRSRGSRFSPPPLDYPFEVDFHSAVFAPDTWLNLGSPFFLTCWFVFPFSSALRFGPFQPSMVANP